jgi:hypothetical protein
MAENDNNAQLSEQELEAEISLDDVKDVDAENVTPEQVAAMQKHLATLQAQKSHWRTKAQKAATAPVAPAPINNASRPEERSDTLQADVERLKQSDEKRSFGHRHTLSPEETDNVFAAAQGMGIKPDDALNHPFVKSGLEAMRTEARNASNTPSSSNRSPRVEGKTFDEMSDDERKNNFANVVSALSKK